MTFDLVFYLLTAFTFMTRDNLGNTYVISKDNSIEKIDTAGKVISTYNENKFGQPVSIDASNPLNIVVFYRAYFSTSSFRYI